jgi:putative cell wall-binding protein
MSRLRVVGIGAALLGLVGTILVNLPAGATSNFTTVRFAGSDRYDTSAKIATQTFTTAPTVIMASGANYPDALAGSFLAGNDSAPVLLTTPTAPVPDTILSALQALQTKTVILLGGSAAIGNDVAAQLASTPSSASGGGNIQVSRISGATRYDTALTIATASGTTVGTVGGQKTAIVASGANFPDALAGGPAAFASKLPLLLTDPNSESSQTEQGLTQLGITQVLLLGGPNAVSTTAESQMSNNGARTVVRFAGVDRTDTARQFYEYELSHLANFTNTKIALANGGNFPDALSGAPQAAKDPTGILLTESPNDLGQYTTSDVQNHSSTLTQGFIYGGDLAVSANTEGAFIAAAGGSAGHLITLNNTSVPAGGAITGTVANPSTLSSLKVIGCGITTSTNVPFNTSSGAFSVTIPTSQAAGTCSLSFTATDTGGASSTQQFPITITGLVGKTAGPDLVSASATQSIAQDTVTYVFDKTVTLAATDPSPLFHIYNAKGVEFNGVAGTATASGANVTVAFQKGAATGVTIGTVEGMSTNTGVGAVYDLVNGVKVYNPIGSVPMTAPTQNLPSRIITNEPDLVCVRNPQGPITDPTSPFVGDVTVDFVFDQPVSTSTVAFDQTNVTGFSLVDTGDNPILQHGTTVHVNVPTSTDPCGQASGTVQVVTVPFDGTTSYPSISRGIVAAKTENSTSDTNGNPAETALAQGGGGAETSSAELTGAADNNDNTVDFTFDHSLASVASSKASNFHVIFTNGTTATASAVSQANDPSTVVTATFSSPSGFVGAYVDAGAVAPSTNASKTNQVTSSPATALTGTPGTVSAKPYLVSITFGHDASNNPTVTYAFSATVPTAFNARQFFLYDVKGCLYHPDGTSECPGQTSLQNAPSSWDSAHPTNGVVSGKTVTFTTDTEPCGALGCTLTPSPGNQGFVPAALSGHVLGAVMNPGVYPEGALSA